MRNAILLNPAAAGTVALRCRRGSANMGVQAGVLEQADGSASKADGVNPRVGSIPTSGTIYFYGRRKPRQPIHQHQHRHPDDAARPNTVN